MRAEKDVRTAPKGVLGARRLRRSDVKCGSPQPPAVEGSKQGILVDYAATAGVDDNGAGWKRPQFSFANETPGGLDEGNVDCQDIRAPADFGKRERCDPFWGFEMGVEADNCHTKGPAELGRRRPSRPEADNAQHPPTELAPDMTFPGPGAYLAI